MNEIFFDRKGKSHKKPTNVKVKSRTSAYGVFKQEGKVLLVRNNWSDKFELPGGGKKKSETLLGCLKREMQEETGFVPIKVNKKPLAIIKSNFFADDIKEYFKSKMYFFKVKKVKETKKKIDTYEIREVIFLPESKVSKSKVKGTQIKVIKKS